MPDAEFDFNIFLQGLSKVVYKPLLYLVHYSQSSELNQQWNITKFSACLPLQPKREELADNGSVVIIENPEAHLHPRAQSRIMEFLIDQSKRKDLQ